MNIVLFIIIFYIRDIDQNSPATNMFVNVVKVNYAQQHVKCLSSKTYFKT